MKKAFFFCAALLLLLGLTACNGTTDPVNTEETEESTAPVVTTEDPDADSAVELAEIDGLVIGKTPVTECRIVVGTTANKSIQNAAEGIADAIEAAYGVRLPVITDDVEKTGAEIVFGATNRSVSARVNELDGKKVAFVIEGSSLAIGGANSSLLGRITEHFIKNYIDGRPNVRLRSSDTHVGEMIKLPLRAENSGDPCITYDPETGYYYALYSAPKNDRVTLYRSKTLAGLSTAEGKEIYVAGEDKEVKHKLYAPELKKIDGKWYIYASGATSNADKGTASSPSIRLFCLEAVSDDPYGDYVFKAFLDDTIFAIDAHAFTYGGQNYIACALISGGNNIMVARLKNPWTIDLSDFAIISKATLPFETMSGKVNEGPFTFTHDGRLFMLYSANNVTSSYYSLGLLEFTGTNICDAASWTKVDHAVFASTSEITSPGHCSVFLSPDGNEYWLAYHYRENSKRVLGVKPFTFDENGNPVFGEPAPSGTYILPPSGE